MERSVRFVGCTTLAAVFYGVGLSAQVTPSAGVPPFDPPVVVGIASKMFSVTAGEMERVTKGAPFAAQAITTTTQVLGDGNRIVQTQETSLARDGEGRSRRDLSIDKIGPWSTETSGHVVIIRDPVAGFSYELTPDGQHAMKTPLRIEDAEIRAKLLAEEQARLKAEPEHGQPRTFAFRRSTAPTSVEMSEFNTFVIDTAEEGPAKIESLGEQTIEGVRAQGNRETRTIPAGKIGNERAIEIVSETWYSPDLHMIVQSRHSDPRTGETVYRLSNLVVGEPDPSLFQLPAGVTVDDMQQLKQRMEFKIRSDKGHDEHLEPPQPDQP
jgi:hypothetical protein